MAEILSHLLQLIVALALSVIGVEYQPEEDGDEARAVAAAASFAPAAYAAQPAFYSTGVSASSGCAFGADAAEQYEAELPVFVGATGYQS